MTLEPSAAALLAAREREGEREREGGREGGRDREKTKTDMCSTSAPVTTAIFSLPFSRIRQYFSSIM